MKKLIILISLLFPLSLFAAQPVTVAVNMYKVAETGHGDQIGTVVFTDSPYGMIIQTQLDGLTPGPHGFHVHEVADCGDNGLNAKGHYDPEKTGMHKGPFDNNGHLGDLPVLWVDANRDAIETLIAPRLQVSDLAGRSIMIHADGDNYSDDPKALGGGGARIACGVV